jgi:hypothetical protein
MKAMANTASIASSSNDRSPWTSLRETLHGLAKRHESRNLIRIWVKKLEAKAFDEDARAADLLQEYEAKIGALERMVGRQAHEIEFLKAPLKSVARPRSEVRYTPNG